MSIHPTAIIAPEARIHPTVKVGPYAVIGPNVEIGENCEIGAHCYVDGFTTMGSGNRLSPFVSIGCPPQDIKFDGQKTFVKIGSGNHFREYVTIHLAEGEGHETTVGDKNLLMAYVHIAHNCHVGSNIIMANCATLAGHVHVGDRAVIGGFAAIHQFCRVGSLVMVGGMSKIVKDVPPFIKIDGNPARVVGLNTIGLKRNGVSREGVDQIRKLFKLVFRSDYNVSQARDELLSDQESMKNPYISEFVEFIKSSKRGIYKRVRESGSGE
ncbi:MAG: acyl-ACP--UDP-N-acetylglucosamine O-acyltransferase [Candidatus Riflebacteria bacterium]|nr:acyl-ACP--UDP-N-acetylglucosamine O-acyltransferase [Candidatus Riflebacteria bacterium]